MSEQGEIIAVCTSAHKGERKTDVGAGLLVQGFGLEGDGHGGDWHRQVSLLAIAGIRNNTLIINLSGSPKAAVENLEAVWAAVSHTIAKIKGDQSECGRVD
jgi:hypothetical protein